MKDKIIFAGACAMIFLVGIFFGGAAVVSHIRVNTAQQAQANLENDLNTRIFPGIQKRFELIEQAQSPASADKKK